MRLNNFIELPITLGSKENPIDMEKYRASGSYDLPDMEPVNGTMTFPWIINVNCISFSHPARDNKTVIWINGVMRLVPLPYEEVKNMIMTAQGIDEDVDKEPWEGGE